MSATSTFGKRAVPPKSLADAWDLPPIRSSAPQAAAAEPEAVPDRTPYLSVALLTLLALIFVFEPTRGLPMGQGMELALHNLMAVGGVSRRLVVEGGEWWRIFTAPLLHANLAHIVGNAVVMAFAAITLERVAGRAWLAAAFVVSAIGGSIGSLLLNDPRTVTVGASGAIMGLLAMILAISLHPSMHEHAKRLRWITLRLFVPSVIPFGALTGSNIDYNGHLGGAVAGGAIGFLLLATWDEEADHPSAGRWLWFIGGAGLALAVTAFALVATRHDRYIERGRLLAPGDLFTEKVESDPREIAALVAAYPRDPRTRLLLARAHLQAHRLAEGEREVRLALAEREILTEDLPTKFELLLRYHLVALVAAQGRRQEATEEARPLCALKDVDPALKPLDKLVRSDGLCPALP
ncbi:rhomboid family intramembrane serine protease [Caulobacter hibisci]|uniref:Rhomboid family intramembrane serine protease n=1 Tax=Caulobacter hibisci TaxID=2035993 RepID=A0ABS0SUW1_9CAUL|nr:rhomboid family intramembrane serine protease [Caulobacter hibisci]MBI1682432.1 rhomboid family intramembrane serine protease [Caulobacter hibisci]